MIIPGLIKKLGYPRFLFSQKGLRTKLVIKGSFLILGSSLLVNLTRLGLIMILSRYFTKEEFGIWATITATASIIAYGDFGIINALRNKLSKLIISGDIGLEEARKYFYSSFIFFVFFCLTVSMIIFIVSRFYSFNILFKTDNLLLKSQGVYILLWIQFIFFLNIPLSMGFASFFSFHESGYNALFTSLQAVVSFIVVVILVLLKYSIVGISIGYFASSTILSGVGTYFFLKRRDWFNYTFDFKVFYSQIKELLGTGVKFMGLQLSNSFLQNAGTILASSFLGLSIAAEFNMVQKLYGFISGIYQSILNPIWGGYAEASVKNDWRWCKKTLNVTMLVSAIIFSLSIVILYFFGNYFLLFFAGKGYITNRVLFLLLGIAYLFTILFSTATILQNATNKINFLLVMLILSCVIIFPLSNVLLKEWNIFGIAIAISIVYCVLACFLTAQSYLIISRNQKLHLVI
jgi:O-antigen/teichoic acid export membrane protein